MEIYEADDIQVFCNFNFEGIPKVQIRYIEDPVNETNIDIFLDTDMIERGEFLDEFNRSVLPVLKEWYNDNKKILKQIWEKDGIYRFWIGINMENTYVAKERKKISETGK